MLHYIAMRYSNKHRNASINASGKKIYPIDSPIEYVKKNSWIHGNLFNGYKKIADTTLSATSWRLVDFAIVMYVMPND